LCFLRARTRRSLESLCARLLYHRGKVFSVVLGQSFTTIGFAVGSRLLTEYAAPRALGEYKLAVGFLSLFSGLFFRPFSQFVMRAYHDAVLGGRGEEFLHYAHRTLDRASIVASPLVVFVLVCYGVFSHNVAFPTAALAGVLVYFQSALNLQSAVVTTQNRQVAANVTRSIMQAGVPFAGAAVVLTLGQSGASLVFAELVFLACIYTVTSRVLGIGGKDGPLNLKELADWNFDARKFVLPLVSVGLFSWVLSISDRYILAAFSSAREVGIYSATYGLASQPILIVTGAAAQILYPFLFKAAANYSKPNQAQLLRYMMLTTTCSAAVVILGIVLFGGTIVRMVLAEEYRQGSFGILVWVAVAHCLLSIAAPVELKNHAQKKTSVIAISYGIASVTNLLLNCFWIPNYGALGAAKATCFGFAAYLICLAILDRNLHQDLSSQRRSL
jgi:O-antigen/teichoic acid export membrane protein